MSTPSPDGSAMTEKQGWKGEQAVTVIGNNAMHAEGEGSRN